MADAKLTALPAASALDGSELIYISQAGTSKKLTANALAILGIANVFTVSSASAMAVGPNGDTNPVFRVVTNVASAATGLSVTGRAAGANVTLSVLSSGTNEALLIVAKGSGNVQIRSDNVGTGCVINGSSGSLSSEGSVSGTTLVSTSGLIYLSSGGGANDVQIFSSAGGNLRFTNGADNGFGSLTFYTGTSFTRIATGVIGVTSWLQDAGRTRLTADVTNATATMANLTDLSVTLIAGRKYTGTMLVFASNSTAAEGLAFDFAGGTATMTSFAAGVVGTPVGATLGISYSTALATDLTATTATTGDVAYLVAISMVVDAGGTFIPRFSEVSHAVGMATVRLGSYLQLLDSVN